MKMNCFPKLVVNVTYKTAKGSWRGFCAPFDVTCEADTQKEAMAKLEEAVDLYMEGLKKYNFPKHLAIKKLSNSEDQKIFDKIIEVIAERMKTKIAEEYNKYQEFKEDSYRAQGIYSNYYLPQCA